MSPLKLERITPLLPYVVFFVVISVTCMSFLTSSDVLIPEGLVGSWTSSQAGSQTGVEILCTYNSDQKCFGSFHTNDMSIDNLSLNFIPSRGVGLLAVENTGDDMWIILRYFMGFLNVTMISQFGTQDLVLEHHMLGANTSGIAIAIWRRKWKYICFIFLLVGASKWFQDRYISCKIPKAHRKMKVSSIETSSSHIKEE